MRLKYELHAIIGACAAMAFLAIGFTAWWEVRRVHLLEVEARGKAMVLHLSRACAVALAGPQAQADLEFLLSSSKDDAEHRVVSAVVYDEAGRVLGRVGATSREGEVSEDAFLRRVREEGAADRVLSQQGEYSGRWGPHGEALFEFGTPVVDPQGRARGVLVLSLSRDPVAFTFLRTVTFLVLVAALLILLLWFVLYKLLKSQILTPILSLSQAIERVRGGDVRARVEMARQDEIGHLIQSFNELIGILIERDSLQARLEEANRLAEAHAKLYEAHRQLKQAQEQLITNEKHASLGRLVHGLNHELNNPLSAAQNMVPPLTAAARRLRDRLTAAPPAPPPAEAPAPAPAPAPPPAPAAEGEAPPPAAEATPPEPAPPPAPAPAPPPPPPPGPADASIAEDVEDVAAAAEVIARSVTRAINIVRDLGAFSRLGAADLEEVELEAVVREAAAACEGELGPEGRVEVAVDVEQPQGQPLRLKAFPGLLSQVFVNLITNSAQAIEGSGRVRITARLSGGDRVRIDVEDSGPGIPREHLHKVFEPFFTTKEQGRGTGLGLSICLGVIEKHGGTITARRRWRGAHFVIELPLEPKLEPTGDPLATAAILGPSGSASARLASLTDSTRER